MNIVKYFACHLIVFALMITFFSELRTGRVLLFFVSNALIKNLLIFIVYVAGFAFAGILNVDSQLNSKARKNWPISFICLLLSFCYINKYYLTVFFSLFQTIVSNSMIIVVPIFLYAGKSYFINSMGNSSDDVLKWICLFKKNFKAAIFFLLSGLALYVLKNSFLTLDDYNVIIFSQLFFTTVIVVLPLIYFYSSLFTLLNLMKISRKKKTWSYLFGFSFLLILVFTALITFV